MVIAIVAVGFISILATAILSASVANYQMNVMDNNSKKTFYSAESVLDEIYAGVGMDCYDALASSYTYAASNLLTQQTVNGTVFYIQKNNKEANILMQKTYIDAMQNKVSDPIKTVEYLNSFITYSEHADVKSIGAITEHKDSLGNINLISIEDMTVEYMTQKNDNYYSTVTVDVEIAYPDMNVDFVNNTSGLTTYLNYCLIAMDSINVGEENIPTDSSLNGGAFAGDGGININPGSTLSVDANAQGTASTIVTSGDINLIGGNNIPCFNVGNSSIWCKNILVGDKYGAGKFVYSNSAAKTYVEDDLTINGVGSKVTLAGSYYGYGNQGNSTDSSTSSAIIVNGRKSSIDMTSVNFLFLAGRAFLDFGYAGVSQYMTADSIALKGNQEIYLVPDNYIKEGSNPSSSSIDISEIDLTDFFAAKLNLLAEDNCVSKTVNGYQYIYLNFKDKASQAEYVKCILSENYLSTKLLNYSAEDKTDREELMKIIQRSLERFVTSDSTIELNESADVYTNGTLMQVGTTADRQQYMGVYDNTLYDNAALVAASSNKYNRYSIIKSYLYDIDDGKETSFSVWPEKITIDGNDITLNEADDLPTIYSQCVDGISISKLKGNIEHINEDGLGTIAAAVSKGNETTTLYKVPSEATGGIVIANGVDIEIDHDFEGLIITDKTIYVTNNASVKTGIESRAGQALDKYPDVNIFLYEYQTENSGLALDSIGVEDMLSFYNWRKNE